ncbi:MAG: hypothetical protein CEE43_17145 [Promethearchaeota archaeon Loki_b32]|nr:MAG: hypothetical protein CEE43_17145 [Candidatus Lokiarchaeota archaeon Loki_b32]
MIIIKRKDLFFIAVLSLALIISLSSNLDVTKSADVTVSATIASDITCDFSTTTASFGELTTAAVSTAFGSTTINVNSSDVAVVKVQDDGDTTDPGLYNSAGATDLIGSADAASGNTATLAAETEGYGMQATSTDFGTAMTIAVRYDNASTTNDVGGFEITDLNMASSTGSVTNARVIMYYKAAVSDSNLAGSYSDIITYTCSNTL